MVKLMVRAVVSKLPVIVNGSKFVNILGAHCRAEPFSIFKVPLNAPPPL